MAEVALLSAFIVHRCVEGCQAFLGLLLGLGVSVLLEPLFHTETWQLTESVIWYSAWAFTGILSLTLFQKRTLAFFSRCLGYLIKLAALTSSKQPGHTMPNWVVIH